ncbi:protein indeterminate-domain 12 [Dendrobium catenatum]|uniref:Protein EARLY HEADING DATE 2 n=1 Tax=Dendrobium catenatum TaxID=906689 RepID=A0A2I0XC95_9ASPA|nr:protein indeterminate-domain 12 [Dendrobium catenatum]PKU85547.1 Zinc finger protein MAGPIE [Dendrobium catenatum]
MFPSAVMSNSTSISEEASTSLETRAHIDFNKLTSLLSPSSSHQNQENKKKRSQPGNPDPEAEVVALSPNTLMTTNRFVCEICNKGFQRDQNLQLHRRGHNLPWRLRQRSGKEAARKRVYVCPEQTCIHHHPSRALGDLTGIKKHFCRKHGEKKWKCERCSKNYAVHSDWKAHVKTCGSREYRCDCGTIFSRKDSFITHRAFCDALAEESARLGSNSILSDTTVLSTLLPQPPFTSFTNWYPSSNTNPNPTFNNTTLPFHLQPDEPPHTFHPYFSNHHLVLPPTFSTIVSATALLQGASSMGPLPATTSTVMTATLDTGEISMCRSDGKRLTRDFLGVVSGDVAEEDEFLPLSGLGVDPVTSSRYGHSVDHSKTLPKAWRDC